MELYLCTSLCVHAVQRHGPYPGLLGSPGQCTIAFEALQLLVHECEYRVWPGLLLPSHLKDPCLLCKQTSILQ